MERISRGDSVKMSKLPKKEVIDIKDIRRKSMLFNSIYDALSSDNSKTLSSDNSKTTDLSNEKALQTILNKAKLVLSDGVEDHLKIIIEYHKKGYKDEKANNRYVEAYKQALENWCPEIWEKYKNVGDFVASGKWRIFPV